MAKVTNPRDGRLKANRDFRRFFKAAVYEPQWRGTFKDDPTVYPSENDAESAARQALQRTMTAKTRDDIADSDLVAMLRFAMLHEGVKPLSTADNILAELRERIAKREAQRRA